MRVACFPFYKTFRKTGLFLYPKHRSVPKSGTYRGRTPRRNRMERRNLLRNIATIIGFVLAVVAACVVRAWMPAEYAAYAGLAFFATILVIGGLAAFAASKFIK